MYRELLRAFGLSIVAVACNAGTPLSAFLEPNRLPLLPKSISHGEDEEYIFSEFEPFANGGLFAQFQGPHALRAAAKPLPNQPRPRPQPRPPVPPRPNPPPPNNIPPPVPVRPPVRPPPRYNVPPKRVGLPQPQPPNPIGGTLIPWMQIVGGGDDGYPSFGSPIVTPLEDSFVLEGAWLYTETGVTLPMSVMLINDLALLPRTLDLGQGAMLIDWGDLSEFSQTNGRFYLLRADVRLDVLFLPEPSGAASLFMASAAMWLAARRSRR